MGANTQKTLLRDIKKLHHKGQGKAGAAFRRLIFSLTSLMRKMMFFKQCKEELKLSQKCVGFACDDDDDVDAGACWVACAHADREAQV